METVWLKEGSIFLYKLEGCVDFPLNQSYHFPTYITVFYVLLLLFYSLRFRGKLSHISIQLKITTKDKVIITLYIALGFKLFYVRYLRPCTEINCLFLLKNWGLSM